MAFQVYEGDVIPDDSSQLGNPDAFKKAYRSAAERAGKELGIDPNVILGQWGEETNWGKSIIPGTNNLGNIKGYGTKAKDNQTGTTDSYRNYRSANDFADDYVKLIKNKYPSALNAGNDAAKFASALKTGGYAEDKQYVTKVVAASTAAAPKFITYSGDVVTDDQQQPSQQPASSVAPQPTQAQEDLRGLGLGARATVAGALSQLTSLGDLPNTGINYGIK